MKKIDLEKKVLDLEAVVSKQSEKIMDLKIQRHKDGYIHVPFSWGGFGRGLASVGSFLFVLLNFYSLYFFWGYFNILNCFVAYPNLALVDFSQLFFLYPLFAWYFSMWLLFCCLKAWSDGNWDNLDGLVVGLVFGLVGGLED